MESNETALLTFNSLYNVMQNEKKQKTLQKLDDSFFLSYKNFLKEKKKNFFKLKEEGNILKLEKEKKVIKNSKNIFNEIVEIRSQKIFQIAKNLVFNRDFSKENVLKEEEEFFFDLKKILEKLINKKLV